MAWCEKGCEITSALLAEQRPASLLKLCLLEEGSVARAGRADVQALAVALAVAVAEAVAVLRCAVRACVLSCVALSLMPTATLATSYQFCKVRSSSPVFRGCKPKIILGNHFWGSCRNI
eukprot:1210045-Pleurochrysis_carterae.AAC.2